MALEDFDGRRLPGAVGSEEGEDLAARQTQVDAPDRFEAVVGHARPRNLDHNVSSIRSCPGKSIRDREFVRHRRSRRFWRGLPEPDPFVQPAQGSRGPPVGGAEQAHERGHEQRSDHRGVEQYGERGADPELLDEYDL